MTGLALAFLWDSTWVELSNCVKWHDAKAKAFELAISAANLSRQSERNELIGILKKPNTSLANWITLNEKKRGASLASGKRAHRGHSRKSLSRAMQI